MRNAPRQLTLVTAALIWTATGALGGTNLGSPKGTYVTTTDGARLFYTKLGSADRAVVVPLGFLLIDGFHELAGENTVIFYDTRNRGRSDSVTATDTLTVQQDVKDLDDVRRHFGLKRISLIGYSYAGAMIALYALAYPDRVERLVQLGPVPMKYGTSYPPNLTAGDEATVLNQADVERLRQLQRDGYHERHPREYCEQEWNVTRYSLVGNPANVDKLGHGHCDLPNEWPVNFAKQVRFHFESMKTLDVPKERFASITAPTLTVHGTRDRNAPYGSGREWAMTLPNARLLTVPGAAHQSWAEAPELVLGAVRRFLSGDWPPQAEKVGSGTIRGKL